MKYVKILVILVLACFALKPAQAQDTTPNAIDKYFKQYVEDDRFTVVYISSKLFELIGRLDVDGLDIDDKEAEAVLEVAKDLKGLRILVAEDNAEGLYEEAKSKIDTKEYEILMTVRSRDGENFEFLVKEEGDKISEFLMLGGGDHDEFFLLSFVGNIDLEKITKLARTIEEN